MTREFDAVIVGAGPAGAYLGELLSSRGWSVAVLERRRLPRNKVCGGGLSRKAIDLLGFDLDPVARQSIRGAILTFGNRGGIFKDPSFSAWTVVRSEFDAFLAARARAAGAELLEEWAFQSAVERCGVVQVGTSRGELRCRLLFGADGTSSAVRSRVFGKGAVLSVPALEAIVRVEERQIARLADRAVFDFGVMPGGYGWIFPKGDHLNVGVYSPDPPRSGVLLRRHLNDFMARYEILRSPLDVRYEGAAIALRNAGNEFQRGRTWLLGDAAGLSEALFGEGIYFALKSATLAAQAVSEEGLTSNALRYTALLRRELLPELRAARWMARLVYLLPRFTFTHLALNGRVNEDFAGLIGGTLGYRQCLARTLLRFPHWVGRSEPGEGVRAPVL